ncbi:hypothetical protein [Yoonia sp. 2307UL14-13]|uniref:hypothetical protein n=1 Tax=Yoonia sp. 2307UL14-13 TaxID=3126506 RepID=UPI0030A59E43
MLTTLIVSACAKRPDAIAPVSMGNAFSGLSCNQAQTMLATERSNLAALSAEQNSAATGDAVGVFLLGLPIGSATGGDKEGAIAASKGKVIALENRLLSC